MLSFPGQNGHTPASCSGGGRRKALGRSARSGAMTTHLPTIGSLRSSGTRGQSSKTPPDAPVYGHAEGWVQTCQWVGSKR